jgi:hypothetical protein
MFDSLDEQMKHDDAAVTSPREKYMKYGLISLVTIAVVGAVIFALQMMD